MSKKIIKYFALLSLFVCYDIFVIRSQQNFFENILGKRFYINYSISILALILFILFQSFLFQKKIFYKILASLFIIIPLGLQTLHYKIYNMPLSSFAIRTFLDEPLIITKLGFENINLVKIMLYLFFCALIISIFLLKSSSTHSCLSTSGRKNFLFFTVSFLFSIVIYFCGTNWFLILDYQNSMISAYGAIPETIRSFYYKTIKIHKDPFILPSTSKKMPNIVWIIGESVVKKYMSIYGYQEDTMPGLLNLQKSGDLIAFNNVVSIGSSTIVSVPYMLVGLQRNDPEGLIYSTPNIFEYAKARNYETSFISAQDLRWRNFDQFVVNRAEVKFFKTGPDFYTNVNVSKGADDLKVLDESILPCLSKMKPPFLLVVQMDGSHYPYTSHSPQKYKKFLPEESPNSINAYKNTLVYSDLYLTKLIQMSREKDPDVWIFYTTDHGQNIVDDQSSFFNQGYENMVIGNAFFVVPPYKFKAHLSEKINEPIAQSDIFATILHLMDIQKPVKEIDGLSLLNPIPKDRLRLTTTFVTTSESIPTAIVTYPDGSTVRIDFSRKNANFYDKNSVVQFEEMPKEIKNFLKLPIENS